MKMSHAMLKTEMDAPSDADLTSHQLLVRSGLIRQIASGIYSLTPIGWRVQERIAKIAHEEMARIGGQALQLPIVQPASLWRETGRYQTVDHSLLRFPDRTGQDFVLAMTHEESVTEMARATISSYRQLPMMVYQVQTKFRDEARPRGGLIRLREFTMKDAYSFHSCAEDLGAYYAVVAQAYHAFYTRCGIAVSAVESDTGIMGGGIAHEYMMLSERGEDTLLFCDACGYAANREVYEARDSDLHVCSQCQFPLRAVRGIEVGNIFQLGEKYSAPMQALFTDATGARRPLIMGCYGIGISRMVSCIVEANHDAKGIIWPASVAPYAVHLVNVGTDDDVLAASETLHTNLGPDHVLWDDRDIRAGRKFQDADLLGMPWRVTISTRSLASGSVELRNRRTGETRLLSIEAALTQLR